MHPIHTLRQKQADLAAEGEKILKAQFDEGRAVRVSFQGESADQ